MRVQDDEVAQLPLEVDHLPHELELLYDLLEVVVGRQRVDLLAHLRHEVLPGDHGEGGRRLAPLRQVRQHQVQEASSAGEALKVKMVLFVIHLL